MMSRFLVRAVVLCALALRAPAPSRAEDARVARYDAVELNAEVAGNDLKAQSFQGRTLEIHGMLGGVRAASSSRGPLYVVTFAGYAGLGQCGSIRCFVQNKAGLDSLSNGDPLVLRGKVVQVVGCKIAILAELMAQ